MKPRKRILKDDSTSKSSSYGKNPSYTKPKSEAKAAPSTFAKPKSADKPAFGKPKFEKPAKAVSKDKGVIRKDPFQPVRLNKYIAQSGYCARRKADEYIEQGKVWVNGKIVKELGTKVLPSDEIVIAGKPLRPQNLYYILLNKPKGTVTTTADEKGRKTVMDLVETAVPEGIRIFPVGRLDRDTTGVLLFTNDGELATRLMHPSFQIEKIYQVTTADEVDFEVLEAMVEKGVLLEEGLAKVAFAAYTDEEDHRKIGLVLHEGKNRQVRRMFEALKHEVVLLQRTHYGELNLKRLKRGEYRSLNEKEIRSLRKSVKLH